MEDPFSVSKPKPPAQSKIFRWQARRFWLAGLGVFCIGLIIYIWFFWWPQNQAKDLMTLAPIDSVLYANAKNNLWPYPVSLFIGPKDEISHLPLADFFAAAQQSPAFSGLDLKKDFLANCRQASFVLILDENSNLVWAYIFEFKDSGSIGAIVSNLKQKNYANYFELAKNILVVSDSSDALNKIKKVSEGQIFSLAGQVDKNKLNDDLLNIYLSSNNLKSYLGGNVNSANTIFAHLINQDIYLHFNKKNQQWQFSLAGNFFDQSNKNTRQPLIEYLPSDYSFFISNIKLTEVFSGWSKSDSNLSGALQQTFDMIKQTYSFNFFNVADIFTNQGADLVIFNNQNKNAFGFDYLLALPNISEPQLNSLKGLVKIILAQKLPKEVVYTLPDGSQVTELMAQPEFWQWQKQTIDGLDIYYLKEPALSFEIDYAIKDNKLFMASSIDLLKNSLATKDINLKSLIQSCSHQSNIGQYLIFNSGHTPLFANLDLPKGTAIIKEDGGSVAGCIMGL